MKIRGLRRVRQVAKWFQSRFTAKGLILAYHRIAEADLDPWSLCVTPQHFAEHLEVLQKHVHPTSLKQLAQADRNNRFPDCAVAITFDDGYANNLYSAKPILERYNIPATVFVTTGYSGRNREFWWDELDQILLQPGKLPDKLCLKLNGSIHEWELGAAVEYSEEEYRQNFACQAWKAKPGSRLFFYYSVWQKLQLLPEKEREKALAEILSWADAKPVIRQTHRPLMNEEICVLEQEGLVEVGAHTVNHPLLSAHPTKVQFDEIKQSRADLERIVNHPVNSFAYPFGAYTEETVSLVQAAGFTYACSTVEETVRPYSHCFQLPRFEVFNWHGKEFERRLLRWFQC